MVTRRYVALLLVTAAAIGIAADQPPHPSNKWRLECSGAAKSDGEVEIHVTPSQGQAIVVTARISKGRSENQVAQDIRDALRAQLDPARFSAEVDDGEDVLIKKHHGQPDFIVAVVRNTVTHVRIKLNRE